MSLNPAQLRATADDLQACACGRVGKLARKGLCHTCYMRAWRAGTLPPCPSRPVAPIAVRFHRRVNRAGPTQSHMSTPCWLWLGYHDERGYGRLGNILAHRVSWLVVNGSEAGDLDVCHHCDFPGCVNPDHLFLGTAKDNAQDMARKGRNKGFLTDVRPAPRIGVRNSASKLNPDAVRAIRAAHPAVSASALAHEHGVVPNAIWQVIHRKTWREVE